MLRYGITLAAGLATALFATSAAAAPVWVKPQLGGNVPRVDGRHTVTANEFEYAPGHRFFLNNWQGDVEAAWNSEAFVQIQDPKSASHPGRLFLLLKVPRRVHPEYGYDRGQLTVFLRPDIHDSWNCPTTRDHRIELAYSQATRSAPVEWVRAEEFQGGAPPGCTGATLVNPDLRSQASGYVERIAIDVQDEQFFTIEIALVLPAAAFSNRQLKLGLAHVDLDYLNEYRVHTIPNIYESYPPNGSLRWDFPSAWQLLDLGEAVGTEMGFSTYNVGQLLDFGWMPPNWSDLKTSNGGAGEPTNIADVAAGRDHVCLLEVMEQEDRNEILKLSNERRRDKGVREFELAQAPPGHYAGFLVANPPNNMILTSWMIVAKDSVRYTTLGCTGEDDNMVGSARGAKGIVWARIAKPVCENGSDIGANGRCSEDTDPVASSLEWADVFCTHTQAAYDDDHHNANVRNCQFDALKRYMDEKRAPAGGLSRPAVLLGDLNTLGPRSVADSWFGSPGLTAWSEGSAAAPDLPGVSDTTELVADYFQLRLRVGNAERTWWDVTSDEGIDSYDLTSDSAGQGTWIGTYDDDGRPLRTTKDSSADDCTPSYPNLADFGRLDYIMLIPPSSAAWPLVNFRRSPGRSSQAQVDRHLVREDRLFGESGCLSDHAEITTFLNLVTTGEPPAFNPNKSHVLRYRVSRLYDINNADDSFFGNDATDWYTNGMSLSDGVQANDSFNDDSTPDGRDVDPGWSILSTPTNDPNTFVQSDLYVDEYDFSGDDEYDASPIGGCLRPRFRLFHSFDNLNPAFGLSPTIWLTDCNGALSVKKGSFASQNAKNPLDGTSRTYDTRGNGDDGDNDALVRHTFRWCEVASDPSCSPP